MLLILVLWVVRGSELEVMLRGCATMAGALEVLVHSEARRRWRLLLDHDQLNLLR